MKKTTKNPVGRPSSYTKEVIKRSYEYLEIFQTDLGELIPTIVGLCAHIKRAKGTVYRWKTEEDKQEFKDILSAIEENQEKTLINGGLSNAFNSAITKMMLTKHGYSDKQEIDHTTNGESITGIEVTYVNPTDPDA